MREREIRLRERERERGEREGREQVKHLHDATFLRRLRERLRESRRVK